MVQKAFGILVGRFRVLLTTMEQNPKVVLRSHQGGADYIQPPQTTPADYIQPPQNDQGEQGQNENLRNLLREAKHQRDLLKDYFNNFGELVGQEDRI